VSPNLKAFRDTIAFSELGLIILSKSDNGYNVLVGSTPDNVVTFKGYADHPHIIVQVKQKNGNIIPSSAAGRYQIMRAIFDHYKIQLNLPDFSPASQDAIANQLIKECGAIADIEAGRFDVAIFKCKSRWASLPGANYPGQRMNPIADLRNAFVKAGGVLA
jgi:muramidase (phage lysozyme)